MMRRISYANAMYEGFVQLLEADPDVFVLGQGLWSPWYVGSTMTELEKRFGKDRILDTPVCENATTGVAIGAALTGRRPILVHPRMDFALLAMDPIVNQAANWSYLFSAQVPVPMVIRAIVNRGGEQGAQHSQALQSFFMHVPGIKVVMPATAGDAKALLAAAVYDGNPVLYIDDRWLYEQTGEVADGLGDAKLGQAEVRRAGRDVTVVAASYMLVESLAAAAEAADLGISAEIIDLRTVKPWDVDTVVASVRKTGRLVVADSGWVQGGIGAEIVATVCAACHGHLHAPPARIGLPSAPAPCARSLEDVYYPRSRSVRAAIEFVTGRLQRSEIISLTDEVPGLVSI